MRFLPRPRAISSVVLIALAALTSACGMDGNYADRPDGYTETTRKADEARLSGNYGYAMPLYSRALQMNPQGTEAKLGLAQVYLATGTPDEAAALYRDILAHDSSAEARRGLALSMINMGEPTLAEHQLDEALKTDSRDYKTINIMGVSLDMQGRHPDAQARYRQGLALRPEDPALRCNLGLSLAISGDAKGAIADLVPAATSTGADARVRQNLALAYALEGDLTNALRYSRRDLGEVPAQRQLSYFIYLRSLSPEERSAEIRRNPSFFPQQGH